MRERSRGWVLVRGMLGRRLTRVGGSGPRVTANLLSLERPRKGVGDVAVHRLPPAMKILGELFRFCREEEVRGEVQVKRGSWEWVP
jgi:hypothetical protein